jgi:hypothetical protein
MRSHTFAPPLYPFVFAAFVRRQAIPPDCKSSRPRILTGPTTEARLEEAGFFNENRSAFRGFPAGSAGISPPIARLLA